MSSVVAPKYLEQIFEKVLSETDSKHRLAYPVQHLHHLHHLCSNPDEFRTTPIDFNVIDCDGNPYLLRLTLRREGFLKPEITGDWMRFVRAKNLKPSDKVIFKKHPINNSDGVVFTIAVRRAVVVFRSVFGYAQLVE